MFCSLICSRGKSVLRNTKPLAYKMARDRPKMYDAYVGRYRIAHEDRRDVHPRGDSPGPARQRRPVSDCSRVGDRLLPQPVHRRHDYLRQGCQREDRRHFSCTATARTPRQSGSTATRGHQHAARQRRFGKRVARPGDVAASTQNQALSALLFLYKIVLDRPLARLDDQVVRARTPERPPTVFSREETRAVLARPDGPRRPVRLAGPSAPAAQADGALGPSVRARVPADPRRTAVRGCSRARARSPIPRGARRHRESPDPDFREQIADVHPCRPNHGTV